MDGDPGFIQLEMGIVGMLLIKTVDLRRSVMSISADGFGSIVNCPVIEHISGRAGGRGGTQRCAGVDTYGFRGGRNSTHIRAVGRNGIADGDFVFFPHGEHIVITALGLFFVSGHLSS